ncbi:hypothetical protein SISNIDRAFT_130371 [Sistotremastrum niveocremeum HHB9708]|uniref:Uncharacterized protein n=1 Tax=Sistotremastrum niveocremeum HHB9708 TaxID=1314777 RepID=A0A164T2M6_9AGAM|nr:hypothetical protein SISNIDRAFT_130371 [Sistotremastrum niveocremeum HHB9708]
MGKLPKYCVALDADPQCRQYEPERCLCALCGRWITLTEGAHKLFNWRSHKRSCVPRVPITAPTLNPPVTSSAPEEAVIERSQRPRNALPAARSRETTTEVQKPAQDARAPAPTSSSSQPPPQPPPQIAPYYNPLLPPLQPLDQDPRLRPIYPSLFPDSHQNLKYTLSPVSSWGKALPPSATPSKPSQPQKLPLPYPSYTMPLYFHAPIPHQYSNATT